MVRPLVVFAVLSALSANHAAAQASSPDAMPDLSGYVTRAASFSDFDVNGLRVITNKKTAPNGIILVPRHIVERLQNDSQLATVLADNIATALEKQSYRMIPPTTALSATQLIGTAGGIFIPGLGLATELATHHSAKSIQTDLLDQSGRVSLGLLHDAGYDIEQAPLAWWTLAAKPSQNILDREPPHRALNLYQTLDLTWHRYPSAEGNGAVFKAQSR